MSKEYPDFCVELTNFVNMIKSMKELSHLTNLSPYGSENDKDIRNVTKVVYHAAMRQFFDTIIMPATEYFEFNNSASDTMRIRDVYNDYARCFEEGGTKAEDEVRKFFYNNTARD